MRVKLKDLGVISTGNTPSKNVPEFYDSNDIGFVKPDIISDSQIDYIDVTQEYLSNSARNKARIVKKNTVLVSCIGSIGKVGIAQSNELAFNQQINAIAPNEKVVSKYLAYCIFANKKRLQTIANAPVVPIINKSQFGDFEIEIASEMEQQEKIVKILDAVDKIIKLHKQQLAKLGELVKARFVEMFGDVANSPKYSGVPLRSICSTLSGGTPTTKVPEYYQGDIPWISTPYLGNNHINGSSAKAYITEDAIKNSATHLIPANTIMFGIRVGVGKSSIIDDPMCANQDIVALMDIDTNKYNLLFVKHTLDSYQSHFDSIKKGATILGITTDDLKKVLIPNVDIGLQNQFATFVEQTDKLKVAVQKALDEAQTLFDSLMQQYFG